MSQLNDSSDGVNKDAAEITHDKKRRRVQQACDMCRHKRVRCEKEDASKACTSCQTNHYTCTYTQSSIKPPASRAYIESLENRLKNMESLIEKLSTQHPNSDPEGSINPSESSPFVRDNESRRNATFPEDRPVSPDAASQDSSDLDSSEDEYYSQAMRETFKPNTPSNPGNSHFFGKSSSVALVRKAKEAYRGYAQTESPSSPGLLSQKRRQFWQPEPWLKSMTQKPHFKYSFPPDDLLSSLIDLHFCVQAASTPLLHRPTFEKDVQSGLHLHDDGFACLVLLVCALAARSSDDPRVRLDDCDSVHSAGWKWFYQVQHTFQVISYDTPRLYDLQIIILMIQFLNGSAMAQNSWPLLGVGLRLAQARGAHRRKVYASLSMTESEQLKRAFWHLVLIDRGLSSAFGLPSGIQDEEIDVDLPLECDDEYWIDSDSNEVFKQPPGKPSRISYFCCCIRLSLIHEQVLRTIYSINKSKANLGRRNPGSEEQMITELDSALNGFMDSIPDHLRWNPREMDVIFLSQSAALYAQYHSLQITVHRTFIPPPGRHSRVQIPSLAICTNAARSCMNVSSEAYERLTEEDQRLHPGHPPIHTVDFVAVFTSAMILLLNIWSSKQPRNSPGVEKDMGEVQKALRIIQSCERRCFLAGRVWDILNGMSTIGEHSFSPSHEQTFPPITSQSQPSAVEESQGFQSSSQLTAFGFPSTDFPFDYDFFSSFAFTDTSAPENTGPSSASASTPGTSLFPHPSPSAQYYVPTYDYTTDPGLAPPAGHYASAQPTAGDTTRHITQDGTSIVMPSDSSQDPHGLGTWSANPAGFHWGDWSK